MLLLAALFMLAPQRAEASGLVQLWLEAQIEDGQEYVWKFYLYGSESAGTGEMTCTYGTKKYEGTWTTSRTQNGKTAYVITFPETETPQFTIQNGNTVALHSSAIVMTGRDEGDFMVDTYMGQCMPFGSAEENGQVAREKFYCEILD